MKCRARTRNRRQARSKCECETEQEEYSVYVYYYSLSCRNTAVPKEERKLHENQMEIERSRGKRNERGKRECSLGSLE